MKYDIRLCKLNEKKKIIDFIRKYWKKNHILAKNEKLLNWQYKGKNCYNFVVANHINLNEFHAILGLISPSFFIKEKILNHDHIWLSIWKVENSLIEEKSLGIKLLDFVNKYYKPNSISAIGINSDVTKVYKFIGFKTGVLKHYYIKNSNLKIFKIAKFSKRTILQENDLVECFYKIKKINYKNLNKLKKQINKISKLKNYIYLVNRYLNHPIYKYCFLTLYQGKKLISLIIARTINQNMSKCLRIVDVINLQSITLSIKTAFEKYLALNELEYVDFLHYGTSENEIKNLGFCEKERDSIIPTLFEPFLFENKNIAFAYLSKNDFYIFKGDSDLDRPNR
jgi:hypothetical protein|tara:strand:+ start:2817 stop:3833 length:1017 start_codon:yes stop_codon:yes gene_type:complete